MTDRTINRGYPYPECDPPLVKDRSDIDFLRQLAVDVNNDAVTRDLRLQDFVEQPDAARIAFAGPLTGTGAANGTSLILPYSSVTYDNTAGSTDLGNFALVPLERGWYMFTSVARCLDGGEQNMMVRHVRTGAAYQATRRFEGPSLPITATEENMTTSDVLLMDAGDRVRTQIRISGVGGSFAFEGRLTMIQLQKLDV